MVLDSVGEWPPRVGSGRVSWGSVSVPTGERRLTSLAANPLLFKSSMNVATSLKYSNNVSIVLSFSSDEF